LHGYTNPNVPPPNLSPIHSKSSIRFHDDLIGGMGRGGGGGENDEAVVVRGRGGGGGGGRGRRRGGEKEGE